MEKVSEVLSNTKVCYIGLNETDNEQGEAHRRRKTMTTDGHRKGSSVSHRKLSDEKFERDIVEVKAHLSVLIELL
jgi:hypothetical protein